MLSLGDDWKMIGVGIKRLKLVPHMLLFLLVHTVYSAILLSFCVASPTVGMASSETCDRLTQKYQNLFKMTFSPKFLWGGGLSVARDWNVVLKSHYITVIGNKSYLSSLFYGEITYNNFGTGSIRDIC